MAPTHWEIYREQMECHNLGDALWNPAPPNDRGVISLGDVGFIHEGRFQWLFSACHPPGRYPWGENFPSTFEPFIVRGTNQERRDPGYLAATTHRYQQVGSPDLMEQLRRSVGAGQNTQFNLTGYRGAALITGDQTYSEDAALPTKFEEYTNRHYRSWVEFASNKGYGDVEPVLVSGFDKTRSYEMMAYSRHHPFAQAAVTISAPTFGSADAIPGPGFLSECAPYFKRHLVQPGQPTVPNQYVFIRYYTKRLRPQDPNAGKTSSELAVGSDADRMIVDEDPEREWVVVRNVKSDKGHNTSWDRISRYVFENSIAKSVLMHHKDLEGIRAMGNEADIAHLLEVHKPGINVDEDGVGRIIFGEGVISSHPATMDPPLNENLDEDDNDTVSSIFTIAVPPSFSTATSQSMETLGGEDLVRITEKVADQSVGEISPLVTMSSRTVHTPPWLNDVVNWDGKSPDIARVLTTAFEAEDYLESIKNLKGRGIEPLSYINSLDKAFDVLPVDSDTQRQCLRALIKTCGLHGILPDSYTVTYPLSVENQRPVTEGGFCHVWRISDGTDKKVYAVKRLRSYEKGPIGDINERYCKEVIVRKQVRHPNILSIEGVAPKLFEFCMVSQWMEHGNVLDYVNRYPEVNRLELLIGVTRGLDHLHHNEVVHGNLRSLNILIDEEGCPRISGFSQCSMTSNIDNVHALAGNRGHVGRHSAPEILQAQSLTTTKSDVYSLSMVIVELVTGKMPFPDVTDLCAREYVLKGERPPKPKSFDAPGTSKAVWEVAEKCWRKKADKRLEAREALQYLENINNGVEGDKKPAKWERVLRRGSTSN